MTLLKKGQRDFEERLKSGSTLSVQQSVAAFDDSVTEEFY